MDKQFAVTIDDSATRTATVTHAANDEVRMSIDGREVHVKLGPWQGALRLAWINGQRVTFAFEKVEGDVKLYLDAAGFRVNCVDAMTKKLRELKGSGPAGGERKINAPMPGVVLTVNVAAGATVTAGQVLCVLEAMKMQNEIRAEQPGIVKQIAVQAGQNVQRNDLLAVLAPPETATPA